MALNQNAQYAYRYLQEKYNLTPEQAAGVVGNLMQESSLSTAARNPGDGSDGSDSIGIAQWNGGRARNLHAFAKANERNVGDLDTQLDFMMHEFKTAETGAWKRLQNATDVHSATSAMIGYERPQGWSLKNPTNGHGWNNRIKYAGQLYGMSPEQIASAQATNSDVAAMTTDNSSAPTTPDATAEKKTPFGLKLPTEVAGVETNKGLGFMQAMSQMMQTSADDFNKQVPKGGLLNGGNKLQFQANANAAAPVGPSGQAPVSGGLLSGGTMPIATKKTQAISTNQAEELERLKRMLGGGLGGLGGLGGFA